MTAEVIDLPRKRDRSKVGLSADDAAAADQISRALRSFETREEDPWEERWEARKATRSQRLELLAEHRARPKITAEDPIFALWDAYKEAKATYDAALLELARQWGVQIINAAVILRSVRHNQKRKAKVRDDLHDLPEGVLPI